MQNNHSASIENGQFDLNATTPPPPHSASAYKIHNFEGEVIINSGRRRSVSSPSKVRMYNIARDHEASEREFGSTGWKESHLDSEVCLVKHSYVFCVTLVESTPNLRASFGRRSPSLPSTCPKHLEELECNATSLCHFRLRRRTSHHSSLHCKLKLRMLLLLLSLHAPDPRTEPQLVFSKCRPCLASMQASQGYYSIWTKKIKSVTDSFPISEWSKQLFYRLHRRCALLQSPSLPPLCPINKFKVKIATLQANCGKSFRDHKLFL